MRLAAWESQEVYAAPLTIQAIWLQRFNSPVSEALRDSDSPGSFRHLLLLRAVGSPLRWRFSSCFDFRQLPSTNCQYGANDYHAYDGTHFLSRTRRSSQEATREHLLLPHSRSHLRLRRAGCTLPARPPVQLLPKTACPGGGCRSSWCRRDCEPSRGNRRGHCNDYRLDVGGLAAASPLALLPPKNLPTS